MGGYLNAPVNGMSRVIHKFFYKYNCMATKIVDILRCSFVFDNVRDLYCGLYMAIRQFHAAHPGLDITQCLWLKDRFYEPLANEYRDIILQVRVPGTGACDLTKGEDHPHRNENDCQADGCDGWDGNVLWAETQFHIQKVMEYKNKCQHKMYEVLRHFPNSGRIENSIVKTMFSEEAQNFYTRQSQSSKRPSRRTNQTRPPRLRQ